MATGWVQVLVLAAAVFMASIDGVRAAVAMEEMLGIWATEDKVPRYLVLDDPSGPLNFTLVDGMKKISCWLDPVLDRYWKDDGSWERIEKSDLPGATLKVLASDKARLVVLYNFKELPVRPPPAPSTVEHDATLGGLMSPPLPSGQSFKDLRMAATPGEGVVVGWGVHVGDWRDGVIHDVHARECTSDRACTATQTLYQGPSGDSSSEQSTTYELLPPLKGDNTYGLIVAEQCNSSCIFRELQLRASRDAQWVATLDDWWSMPGDRSVRAALNTKTGESYFVAYNDGLEEYKFVLATRNVPISVVTLPVGDHLGQRGELRVIYVERHDLFVVLVHLIRGSGSEEKPELLLLRFSAVTGKQIGDRVVLTDIVTELDSRVAFDASLQTETTLVLVSAVNGDGDAKGLEIRYRTDLLVQKIDIGGEGEDSVIKPVQRHPFRGWGWEDSDFGLVGGMTLLPMTGTLVVEIVTVPLLTFSTIRLFKLSGDEAGLRSLPGTDITDVSSVATGLGAGRYSAASVPGKGFAILYASTDTGGLYLKTYDDLPDTSPSVNNSSLTAVAASSGSLHATTALTMLTLLVAGWCL